MPMSFHSMCPALPVSFVSQNFSVFLRPRLLGILLLFALCWAACGKDDPPPEFPKTFRFSDIGSFYGAGRAYWENPEGAWMPLARQQSGTFVTFLDTIDGYARRNTPPLNFTGIELLNAYQVRVFSDGSSGIPPLDTVVRYTGTHNMITVSWTPGVAPLSFRADKLSNGKLDLKVYSSWLVYSYRPAALPGQPQYTSARQYYSGDELGAAEEIIAADNLGFGRGDTLAVYTNAFYFVQ